MSLKPAIGLEMMHEVASELMMQGLDKTVYDVPAMLQHGTKKYPLGRYLRRKLREMVGREPNAPLDLQKAEELQKLREEAFKTSTPLSQKVLLKSLGKRIQINAREKLKSKRDML